MRNRKSLKLSHQLVLGMMLFAILGLGIAVAVVNIFVRDIIYENVIGIEQRDKALDAERFDTWLRMNKQIVDDFSTALLNMGLEHIYVLEAGLMDDYPFLDGVFLGFSDGSFSGFWGWDPGPDWDSTTRPWYIDAVAAGGETVITKPYVSRATGGLVTAVARDLGDVNGLNVVMATDIHLWYVMDLIGQIDVVGGGYMFLVASGGEILTHPEPKLLPTLYEFHSINGIPEYAELLERFRGGEEVTRSVNFHGVESYFISHLLPSARLILITVIPAAAVSTQLWQALWVVTLSIILVLVVVMIFSFVFVSHKFIRPIKNLRTSVGEIAAENLDKSFYKLNIDVPDAERADEIGDLSRAIQNMLREIDFSHEKEREAEKLLHTVNKAALVLLAIEDDSELEAALVHSMELIGKCVDADRVHLLRCSLESDGVTIALASKWLSESGWQNPQIELNKKLPFGVFGAFEDLLFNSKSINGPVVNLPTPEQKFLNPNGTLQSIVIIPLFMNEQLWGALSIDDCVNERILSEKEMDIMCLAGLMLVSTFSRFAQKELATTDALTGVRNRRYFEEMSEHELQNCIKENCDFSIIMTDIDQFKSINDCYGHTVGDEVLKIFTARISHILKKDTLLARYGGEEFVIALPGVGHEDAAKTAWRFNKAIQDSSFQVDDLEITVTASFGIAAKTKECKTLLEIINNADKALYQAKEAGRNTVIDFNA